MHLFILEDEVEDKRPECGEVDVEFPIRSDVGDQEDEDEDHGVGVGDQEPVGNVLGEEFHKRVWGHGLLGGGHGGDGGQAGRRGVTVGIQGHQGGLIRPGTHTGVKCIKIMVMLIVEYADQDIFT